MLHILDFFAMFVNLLCTFLLAALYIVGWPVGIIGLVMSAILLSFSGLYADAILQVVLLFSFGYAWYTWSNNSSEKSFIIQRLKAVGWISVSAIILLLGFVFAQILVLYTNSTSPYLDSYTSVSSFVCVFLASKRIIENWAIWMAVDSVYIFLYLYKGLFFSAITTAVYLLAAVYGYVHWRKELLKLCC